MNPKTNFLKKVQLRNSRPSTDYQQIQKDSKSSHNSKQKHYQLKKEDILQFRFIGIFDKKVIVTFHNRLQLFGYFDIHAIHERIRYEYYVWKIRQNQYGLKDRCPFQEECIEKESKPTKQIYGRPVKILIKVSNSCLRYFENNSNRVQIWGIQLQRNTNNEIYVTSYKPILGKSFTSQEIIVMISSEQATYKGNGVPKVIDQWIGQFSCKSAYKFNDNVGNQQCKLLIYNLSKCSFPWNCVHGRNTIHIKSMEEIQR